MDFFSHLFWAYLPSRNKLWRDEALLFAILPDLGFFFILLYVFASPGGFWTSMGNMPGIYLHVYRFLHSFVALGVAGLVIWWFRPKLLPALSGWLIHILMDIPFHEDPVFSTRFLYPLLPETYVTGITWFDYRFLGISYLAILLTYIYVSRRETKKQRLNGRWRPDVIERLDGFFAGVSEWIISTRYILTAHGKKGSIGRTAEGLSGQDGGGAEKAEHSGAEALLLEEGG